MSHRSTTELLALHGVRVLGGPTAGAIAERFARPADELREYLLDAQAFGWVARHEFGGETWSLTDRGRQENQRQLAEELDACGGRSVVARAYADFLVLNQRHGVAMTDWQLRTIAGFRLANDHSDPVWDDAVFAELGDLDRTLARLAATLVNILERFDGHAQRHAAALARARAGVIEWLDAPDRESCELVWIQFHEDLLATLGIARGTDG